MKAFFFLLAASLFQISIANAQSADECMPKVGCSESIAVDTGKTSSLCNDNATLRCTCASISCHDSVVDTTCPSGYTDKGATATGLRCCHDYNSRCRSDKKDSPTKISSTGEMTLEKIFTPGLLNDYYFGIVDDVNYTPSTGRTVKVDAMLDACFGDPIVVDSFVASSSDTFDQWSACQTACHNGNANCADLEPLSNYPDYVCIDRCNCKYESYGYGTCYGY